MEYDKIGPTERNWLPLKKNWRSDRHFSRFILLDRL